MAKSFNQCLLIFKSTAENVSGEKILEELRGIIDTDSADTKVDEYSVEVRFVTAELHEDMLERCNRIKQRVNGASHERLFYKIIVMSL